MVDLGARMDETRYTQTVRLAEYAAKIGEKQEAIRLYSRVIKEEPRNIPAWLGLELALDDTAKKRQCLERVLLLEPGNQHAVARLRDLSPTAVQVETNVQPVAPQIIAPPPQSPPQPPYPPSFSQSAVMPGTKVCPDCGHTIRASAKFCGQCGRPFSSAPGFNSTPPPMRTPENVVLGTGNYQSTTAASLPKPGTFGAIANSFLVYLGVLLAFILANGMVVYLSRFFGIASEIAYGLLDVVYIGTVVGCFFAAAALRRTRYSRVQVAIGAFCALIVSVIVTALINGVFRLALGSDGLYILRMAASLIAAGIGVLVFIKSVPGDVPTPLPPPYARYQGDLTPASGTVVQARPGNSSAIFNSFLTYFGVVFIFSFGMGILLYYFLISGDTDTAKMVNYIGTAAIGFFAVAALRRSHYQRSQIMIGILIAIIFSVVGGGVFQTLAYHQSADAAEYIVLFFISLVSAGLGVLAFIRPKL
jgi:hypothetical protein